MNPKKRVEVTGNDYLCTSYSPFFCLRTSVADSALWAKPKKNRVKR